MKSSNSSVFELLESPLCFDKAQFENLWLMKPTREQHCILFGQAVVVPRNYEVYMGSNTGLPVRKTLRFRFQIF